ncbi:serine protease [uncultured Tateyamaria sp.]|uniref:S1 family peptidase n=1 Tax=uncultured Tateyamaria sp. TaxID=455651 RepID=UPI00261DF754|nr:serine protease [uncultured Tateyamaria sp.]
MRRTALAICIAANIPSAAIAQGDAADVALKVRNATVYLEVSFVDPEKADNVCKSTNQGTGFIVSPKGGVLTAAHLFKNSDCAASGYDTVRVSGKIGYINAEDFPLNLLRNYPDLDLTILRIGDRGADYNFLTGCVVEQPEIATKLLGFGFPVGQDFVRLPTDFQGMSFGDSRWSVSSNFVYGMSGGPVTDLTGTVIGVIKGGVRGVAAVRTVTPLSWASEAIKILALPDLDACTLPFPDATYTNDPNPPDPIATVEVQFSVTGTEEKELSQKFSFDVGNESSCTEGWTTREYSACLPIGSQLDHVDGPLVISAGNDGRSWFEYDAMRENCVTLFYGYSDRGRDLVGNCRGNGWISASYELRGLAPGRQITSSDLQSRETVLAEEGPTTVVFVPKSDLASGMISTETSWAYSVTVKNGDGTIIGQMTDTVPNSTKLQSKQEKDGTVVVEIAE